MSHTTIGWLNQVSGDLRGCLIEEVVAIQAIIGRENLPPWPHSRPPSLGEIFQLAITQLIQHKRDEGVCRERVRSLLQLPQSAVLPLRGPCGVMSLMICATAKTHYLVVNELIQHISRFELLFLINRSLLPDFMLAAAYCGDEKAVADALERFKNTSQPSQLASMLMNDVRISKLYSLAKMRQWHEITKQIEEMSQLIA
jgi:hypothetical protein